MIEAAPAARARAAARPRLRPGARAAWSVAASLAYVALALLLTGRLGYASAEAQARAAHLGVLLGGADPEPAAFGLERPPLLTALGLPFALLGMRPELAVALGSAVLGGASVFVAADLARWARLGRAPSALFTLAFAAHPLLVVSGAIGLPEALYATLLLAACGQLLRWFEAEATSPVVGTGAAIGAAFLLRYNVALVALVMALALVWVARGRGAGRERERGLATALAFVVPLAFAGGLWALSSAFAAGDPLAFLRDAARLSAIAGNDAQLAAEMARVGGDPFAALWWVLRWWALLALPSLLAVAALAWHALRSGARAPAALAAVLASIALPELVALAVGHGQPRVTHLFALVVPAFVAWAYAERRAPGWGGERRRLALGAGLLAWALATAPLLPQLPAYEAAPRSALASVRSETPRAADPAVAATAAFIAREAETGEVLADPERATEVMLVLGAFDRFRTPVHEDGDELVRDPRGRVRFVLVRAIPAGARGGAIERAHPRLYRDGGPGLRLAHESGPYRIYRVE